MRRLLAGRVDAAVDEAAEHLVQHMLNTYPRVTEPRFAPFMQELQALAREAAGLTASRLEYLGEHDDNNPRYTLYYAELTLLLQKALARTIDKLSF